MSTTPQLPAIEALPHRRMEAWKWTDVRAALAKPIQSESASNTPLNTPDSAVVLSFVDGRLARPPQCPAGVTFSENKAAGPLNDQTMPSLAHAMAAQHYAMHITSAVDTPIVLRFTGQGYCTLAVTLDAKAAATIIEDHGLANGFANTALSFDLGETASLTRLIHQQSGTGAVHVVHADMTLAQAANVDQFSLSFGGRLVRLETQVKYSGVQAQARLNGAYLLDGDFHNDQTYYVDHAVEHCTTRQLVRGVVKDRANGVFQGKFYVARGGQHTDASMNHDALLLNAGAAVHAKPELEIYADDVACAHGNTSGALDDHALFYMRQRGLDEAQAKTLLIRAFLGAAFDDLHDEALRDMMMVPLMNWLERAL